MANGSGESGRTLLPEKSKLFRKARGYLSAQSQIVPHKISLMLFSKGWDLCQCIRRSFEMRLCVERCVYPLED